MVRTGLDDRRRPEQELAAAVLAAAVLGAAADVLTSVIAFGQDVARPRLRRSPARALRPGQRRAAPASSA